MMKHFTQLLLLLLLPAGSLWAQKEGCGEIQPAYSLKVNSIWALSDSLGLDFNTSGDPQAFNTKIYSGPIYNCATVSDSSGALLFYTNGYTVWAADGSVMPHGSYLVGGLLIARGGFYGQTVQVVQVPFQPDKYYLFTIGWIPGTLYARLYCNLIDMSLNSGLGDVVNSFPLKGVSLNNPLQDYDDLAFRLAAIADCSHNVWILTHNNSNSVFKVFKITPAGIDTVPVVSDFSTEWPIPQMQAGIYYTAEGFLSPSPNGRKLVLTNYTGTDYKITDYDFDPATGQVSHPQMLIYGHRGSGAPNNCFAGAVFSPDNSKIYGTYNDHFGIPVIVQYDLNSPVADSLIQPTVIDTLNNLELGSSPRGNGIQLGHDGKIYFGNGLYYYNFGPATDAAYYRKLGRINYPNNAGIACGFEDSVASIDFSSLPIMGHFRGSFPNPVVIPQSSLHISIHFQNDTLFAQPNTFDSYQWYHNGNPVAGGNNPFLPVNDTSGQYAVAVTDTSCGCSDSVLYNITNNLGIGSTFASNKQIRIYPNPTHDKIFVEAPLPVNLSLYDLTGRLLRQSEGKNQMDIAAFADGVYLLRIEDRQGRFIKMEKVVKRK